jgi:hypothetical protein
MVIEGSGVPWRNSPYLAMAHRDVLAWFYAGEKAELRSLCQSRLQSLAAPRADGSQLTCTEVLLFLCQDSPNCIAWRTQISSKSNSDTPALPSTSAHAAQA